MSCHIDGRVASSHSKHQEQDHIGEFPGRIVHYMDMKGDNEGLVILHCWNKCGNISGLGD